MSTCKNCVHNGLCTLEFDEKFGCTHFKPKSHFVELPVEIGQEVYTNTAMQGWYLREKDKPYSAKVVFIGINGSEEDGGGFFNVLYAKRDYMFQFKFSDIGKTVFLTKE